MKEKKSRVEDALHATRAAVEEGIGAGGGVALLRARAALDALHFGNRAGRRREDRPARAGGAAAADRRQRGRRAGDRGGARGVRRGGTFGYNAATGEFGDVVAMGIIDPTKVTRLGLQNAASIASLVLTTDCIIVEKRGHKPAEEAPGQE